MLPIIFEKLKLQHEVVLAAINGGGIQVAISL